MTPEELTAAIEGIHRSTMIAVGATPATIVLLGLSQLAATVVFIAVAAGLLR
jgi:hypothetical protein